MLLFTAAATAAAACRRQRQLVVLSFGGGGGGGARGGHGDHDITVQTVGFVVDDRQQFSRVRPEQIAAKVSKEAVAGRQAERRRKCVTVDVVIDVVNSGAAAANAVYN